MLFILLLHVKVRAGANNKAASVCHGGSIVLAWAGNSADRWTAPVNSSAAAATGMNPLQ